MIWLILLLIGWLELALAEPAWRIWRDSACDGKTGDGCPCIRHAHRLTSGHMCRHDQQPR